MLYQLFFKFNCQLAKFFVEITLRLRKKKYTIVNVIVKCWFFSVHNKLSFTVRHVVDFVTARIVLFEKNTRKLTCKQLNP